MCAKPTLDQRRSQILSAALKTFAASGYVAARIPDIAGAAGISQGLLYRYFPSKEELFNELIGSAFARMNEATRTLELLPLPPAKKICLALRKLLDSIATSEDFSMYFLLIAQASVCDAIPEKAKAIIREQRLEPYIIIGRIMKPASARARSSRSTRTFSRSCSGPRSKDSPTMRRSMGHHSPRPRLRHCFPCSSPPILCP